jgi:hypothetical protein
MPAKSVLRIEDVLLVSRSPVGAHRKSEDMQERGHKVNAILRAISEDRLRCSILLQPTKVTLALRDYPVLYVVRNERVSCV